MVVVIGDLMEGRGKCWGVGWIECAAEEKEISRIGKEMPHPLFMRYCRFDLSIESRCGMDENARGRFQMR
jgi:hypothetical protein